MCGVKQLQLDKMQDINFKLEYLGLFAQNAHASQQTLLAQTKWRDQIDICLTRFRAGSEKTNKVSMHEYLKTQEEGGSHLNVIENVIYEDNCFFPGRIEVAHNLIKR